MIEPWIGIKNLKNKKKIYGWVLSHNGYNRCLDWKVILMSHKWHYKSQNK
jgi:hypothetical protein